MILCFINHISLTNCVLCYSYYIIYTDCIWSFTCSIEIDMGFPDRKRCFWPLLPCVSTESCLETVVSRLGSCSGPTPSMPPSRTILPSWCPNITTKWPGSFLMIQARGTTCAILCLGTILVRIRMAELFGILPGAKRKGWRDGTSIGLFAGWIRWCHLFIIRISFSIRDIRVLVWSLHCPLIEVNVWK